MTMIAQLLVFTYACALGVAENVLSYTNIADSIARAHKILQDNVLSMEGNIPLMNDPRRHYAEILHVIKAEAFAEESCLLHDYFTDYQKNINTSAPDAIVNPQKVIDEVKQLIKLIHKKTQNVSQLLSSVVVSNPKQDPDTVIVEAIKNDPGNYGVSNKVYLATGIAATELNLYDKKSFSFVSNNLSAHNFIITGAEKLKKIVEAVRNLYEKLSNRNVDC